MDKDNVFAKVSGNFRTCHICQNLVVKKVIAPSVLNGLKHFPTHTL